MIKRLQQSSSLSPVLVSNRRSIIKDTTLTWLLWSEQMMWFRNISFGESGRPAHGGTSRREMHVRDWKGNSLHVPADEHSAYFDLSRPRCWECWFYHIAYWVTSEKKKVNQKKNLTNGLIASSQYVNLNYHFAKFLLFPRMDCCGILYYKGFAVWNAAFQLSPRAKNVPNIWKSAPIRAKRPSSTIW